MTYSRVHWLVLDSHTWRMKIPAAAWRPSIPCSVVCTCALLVKKKGKTSSLYLNSGCLFCLKQRMDPLAKNGSWSADTGNRATGWGTPTGSARPRSCAPGRCSGIVLSWSRRRSPRGRRPNSRPPNHRQAVGQSLQRFTCMIQRQVQTDTVTVLVLLKFDLC